MNTAAAFVRALYPEITGKVLAVRDDCFIVGIGSAHGISSETEFVVSSECVPVHDPDTGRIVGYDGSAVTARPVAGSVQSSMCRAVPGRWEESTKVGRTLQAGGSLVPGGKVVIVEWKWKPDFSLLARISPGDRVSAGAPSH